MHKQTLTIILLLISSFSFSQELKFSTKVRYPNNAYKLDSTLYDNIHRLRALDGFLDSVDFDVLNFKINCIQINSTASPSGALHYNEKLVLRRFRHVETYIKGRVNLPTDAIINVSSGIAWEELRELVAGSTMKSRDSILSIIDNTKESFYKNGVLVESRNNKLMEFEGGIPYNYMRRHFFPILRKTTVVVLYRDTVLIKTPEVQDVVEIDDKAVEIDKTVEVPVSPDTIVCETFKMRDESFIGSFTSKLSIKTNLLYLAALAPNIGFEYHVNPRWSVGVMASVPWWSNAEKHQRYQLQLYELEARRYLGLTKRHHLGVYLQGGLYSLKFGDIGDIGEFGGAGLSYGYLLPLTNRLSLDFEIGFGYIYTNHKQYQYVNGRYEYINDPTNYYVKNIDTELLIPTKLGVTLVWKL